MNDPSPPASSRPPKRASGPRFVEPCRFDASQRATLLTALEAEGLGDEDSRQIFLAALEYDLASCRPLLGELPPPEEVIQPQRLPATIEATVMATASVPAATPTPLVPPDQQALDLKAMSESTAPESGLLALAHLAADLAQALADLTLGQRETLKRALESSDCLARGYGDRYLDTLRLELLHLKAALSASELKPGMAAGTDPSSTIDAPINYPPSDSTHSSSPSLAPPVVTVGSSISDISSLVAAAPLASMANMPVPPPSPPPVPAEVRRFLRRAADAYADCFEGDPSLAADAPLPRILRVLGDVTGLPLPKDELTLSEILVPGP